MDKWEYTFKIRSINYIDSDYSIELFREYKKQLNKLGKEGWELISTNTLLRKQGVNDVEFWFKRKLKS